MKWVCPVHPHIVLFDDEQADDRSKGPQYCHECGTYYEKRECDEITVA